MLAKFFLKYEGEGQMIPLQEKIPSTSPALSGLTAGGSFAEFRSPSENLANIQKDYP